MARPVPLPHRPADRNAFERAHGVSMCRRCGRILEWDEHPGLVRVKPCYEIGWGAWNWPLP